MMVDTPHTPAAVGPARVLIVDDEEVIRELLAEFLGAQGMDVTLAGSAEQGLELCKQQQFQAILVDYDLPGMNGLDFCRRMAATGSRARLALMTGWGSMEAAEKEPSLSRIIAKPFDLMTMLATVQELTAPA